jgi:hypothetical protein
MTKLGDIRKRQHYICCQVGWVGLEPTVYNLWLKARSVRRYGNHPIKGLNCQCAWWSQPLLKNTTETVAGQVVCASSRSGPEHLGSRSPTDLLRLPPFRPLWVIGGHLRNCHKVTKKGRKLLVSLPFYFYV